MAIDTRVRVYLGNSFYGDQVEGLCGNYNGLSGDDIGAETEVANALVDQASAWKTVASCVEPPYEPYTEACEVGFR